MNPDPAEVAARVEVAKAASDHAAKVIDRGQHVRTVMAAVALCVLVVLSSLSTVYRYRQNQVISEQTSPAAIAKNQERLRRIEYLLIGCEENHLDRQVDQLTHKPLVALRAGCPPDGFGR